MAIIHYICTDRPVWPAGRSAALSFLLFFAILSDGYSQGEIDTQDKIFYRNERTWAGSLNSNGWGINFRYAKRLNATASILFDGDLASIRHPKEVKSQSPYKGGWGRSYVFGKINEAFSLRAGSGYQKELFGKFDQGGISVRAFGGGGLSLAILKPVLYYKLLGIDPVTFLPDIEPSPFDPDYMQSIYDIYDSQSFFAGIGETTFLPGVFARAGLCFEYGSEDRVLHALEGGIQVEGFLRKLPILAIEDNQQLFITLFAAYRFGKVLDARFQK